MYYTDNPVADFERRDAEQEKWLESRPVCCECGEHIQDEYCYEFNSEYMCADCLKEYHEVATENIQ